MNIFDEDDEEKLCSGVYLALYKKYDDLDASKCSDEYEFIGIFVWTTIGMVGNEGIYTLFEAGFRGDMCYEKTFEAFRKIGAHETYYVLMQLLDLLPGKRFEPNIEQRMATYENLSADQLDQIEIPLFRVMDDEVTRQLASFIRQHRREYEALLA